MDLRSDLLNKLLHYHPMDSDDAAQQHRIIDFVEKNSHCFERTHVPGHITGSAWLLDVTGTKILLTHHAKLNMWLQLGGHADGEHDILAVALREAIEESGITHIEPLSDEIFDVDIHPIPALKKDPAHVHYDIRFAFHVTQEASLTVSAESHELAWVPLEKLESFSQEMSLLRMKIKWLNRKSRRKYE